MIGSGTRSTTRSSRLHTGHLKYLNQDLASCKLIPARGRVSSCWQCLQRKTGCFIHLPSNRDYNVDTCRVSWEGCAICPQPADLDVDTCEMTRFLLLQHPDGLLPGYPGNEPADVCLFSRTHLVDPYTLPGDEQGECPRFDMRRCSCLVDGIADCSIERVATSQAYRGFVPERTGHQLHNRHVVVGFSTTSDLDAHCHLDGVTADQVIGGHRWLALHRSSQALVGVYLVLQAGLRRWGKRSQEWPSCVVDIRLGHHRVIISILSAMKGCRVLDRYPGHTAQAIEVEGSNVALWPNDCGMGRNGDLPLIGGMPRRDDSGGIGEDLDPIGSGEHGARCDCLAVGRGIVEGELALPYLSRRMAGTGGGNSLALY